MSLVFLMSDKAYDIGKVGYRHSCSCRVWALLFVAWSAPAAAALLELGADSQYFRVKANGPPTLEVIRVSADILRSNTAQWREFESKDGRFSVQFPGRPQRTEQKTRTDIGHVISVRYTVNHSGRVTYDLMFNDFPKAQIASVKAERLWDAARDSLIYQTGGRITSEVHTMHNGARARQFEIADKDGTRFIVRLLFADNRLYQLLVASPYGAAAEAQRFFNSFSLSAPR